MLSSVQHNRAKQISVVPIIMILASFSIVISVVLLANGGHNLKAIGKQFGVAPPESIEPSKTATKLPRLKVPELKRAGSAVSSRLLGMPAAILRQWTQRASALCSNLDGEGFEMSPWRVTAIDKSLYECFGQKQFISSEGSVNAFASIRGNRTEDISSIRFQATPEDAASGAYAQQILGKITAMIVQQENWRDLESAVTAPTETENIPTEKFGILVRSFSDRTGRGVVNIVFQANSFSEAERTNRLFFDRTKWLSYRDLSSYPQRFSGSPASEFRPLAVTGHHVKLLTVGEDLNTF